MKYELTKLGQSNYIELQKEINKLNPEYYLSAQYLLLWKRYGASIWYYLDTDAIYLFYEYESKENRVNKLDSQTSFYIIKPITRTEENSYPYLKKSIEIACENFIQRGQIFFTRLWKHDLKWFDDYEIIYEMETSFIYETDQLKYFPGKKMQKKRNMLNFYKNNYEQDSKIVKYEQKYVRDVLLYCKNHILENSDEYRAYEYDWIKGLVLDSRETLYGSILYYKDQIAGVTIGCIHNDIFEIFLEKANRNLKGAYQYLLSQNLILHNINTKYIDRQDSENQEGLSKSKRSYKPINIITTYTIKVKF